MALGDLRFLADLNISPQTVEELRKVDWEILRADEQFPVTAPDEELLTWAHDHGYVVITQDLDFSTLVALRGWQRPSLLTLRLSQTDPTTVTARLREVVPNCAEDLAAGCAVTIEDGSVRIRSLPIR